MRAVFGWDEDPERIRTAPEIITDPINIATGVLTREKNVFMVFYSNLLNESVNGALWEPA